MAGAGMSASAAMDRTLMLSLPEEQQKGKRNKRKRARGMGIDEDSSESEAGSVSGASISSSAEFTCDVTLPSAEDVNKLIAKTSRHKDTIIKWLAHAKKPNKTSNVNTAINSICDVVTQISTAYLSLLASDNTAKTFRDDIIRACKSVERVATSFERLPASANNATGIPSFAEVAARGSTSTRSAPSLTVSVGRGKAFPISHSQRIVIGPTAENSAKFANSKATKDALQACVNPAQLKMKIRNVRFGPNSSVMIEGEDLNTSELHRSQAIVEAGLEIKQQSMWNPRLVIHDIPVNLSSEDIVKCIVDQNLIDATTADIEVKYLYPAGTKSYRSCVIELSPGNRRLLLNSKRVNIGWMACRVEDHVSIRQCFKCHGFGHFAKDCSGSERCGKCAGEHGTKDCTTTNTRKCVNCIASKLPTVTHSAYDKAKCPILRKKIEYKISSINYGE